MTNKYLKGMCYSPFPTDYNPSTANDTCIFYGSDIATLNLKPLWGLGFSPVDGPDKNKIFMGRDDLGALSKMGVNLIRLYDWDPRNNHLNFLEYCSTLGIKVLVPVSNYNLGMYDSVPNIDDSITKLIYSFSNRASSDYHSAIYGILIGNETDLPSKMPKDYHIQYTKRWVELEAQHFNCYSKLPIGHPVSFAKNANNFPCFDYWDNLLYKLKDVSIRNLNKRLILCPQTFNDAAYLYENAEGKHQGWVDIAYKKYNLPILFTEIGCNRLGRDDYNDIIANQLEKSWEYQKNNPEKLLGTCFFQFCDKAWLPDTSEGSFGIVTLSKTTNFIVKYGTKDFTNFNECENQFLRVQALRSNPTFNTVKLVYTSDKGF